MKRYGELMTIGLVLSAGSFLIGAASFGWGIYSSIRSMKFNENAGIGTAIHYPVPIHLMSVGRKMGHRPGDFPVTEDLAGRILSLPIYPELTSEQLNKVADTILDFYKNN